MRIRHTVQYRPEPRGVTPRRLSAAKRALRRERERLTLFASEVAEEQETPEERIDRCDREMLRADQGQRDLAAKHWRWGRSQLSSVRAEVRAEILDRWNKSWIPAHAAYFADFVHRELKRLGLPHADDA